MTSDFDALIPLLREELNVKQVEVATSADALVTLEAKPNFRSLGKRFGKKTPLAAVAVQAFRSTRFRSASVTPGLSCTLSPPVFSNRIRIWAAMSRPLGAEAS